MSPKARAWNDSADPGGPRPTAEEVFSRGRMLEVVSGTEAGKLTLLLWTGRRARMADEFEVGGRVYVPVRLDSATVEAIRFPGRAANYGTTAQLFERILDVVNTSFNLPARELRIITYWALASWFPDVLPTSPVLIISGPSPAEVRLFLRLLRALCRRGVLLTEVNPGGFVALPLWLRPTVLVDQTRITAPLRGLLRAASGSGAYFTKSGDFLNLRCGLAVYSVENDIDTELTEGLLRINVAPGTERANLLDERVEIQIATEFQPQLLQYRLANYEAVRESTFDAPGFTTGLRQLARALGASVVGDTELQSAIVPLLSRQDEGIRARLTTLPEYGIITVLLSYIHEGRESVIPVKVFTDFVNTALRANGEIFDYSPEQIGRRLAAMQLYSGRTSGGMAIRLTRQVSRIAHDLKPRYGVTTTPADFPGCPDCEPTEPLGNKRLM
jgi:hypothetical protein